MAFEFMTREVWDALIIGALIIGAALAALRLYTDFTRPDDDPLPPSRADQPIRRRPSQPKTPAETHHPDSQP
ncbi:MAG: hypothetical protein IT298_05980 [Chloroflexi bacterium]|jgi:hypothetical protein|nr:MAG: hypothetical protein UZ13_03753 [Chloroflexi bacterium OLB13]MBC6955624.1 hypothetical protein [Chloroflexota bacterium]MBV6437234.1 hypothetical protein [Anaerolineae bacterium]MDL1914930.1 hypothetical protein [Anaerolineae bacterium CFX4]OQY84953.1 MAG: hypothetical protein B6D42_04250 [Anaerolineae bacterium UTCFX5]